MLERLTNSALILMLAMLVLSSVSASEDKAWIVTSIEKPVECISAVSIYSIDRVLVGKNAMGFELDPGQHSLVGTVTKFSPGCPIMRTTGSLDIPPLDYEFEAGKTYYIGLEHKSSNPQNWRFVVWRTEE